MALSIDYLLNCRCKRVAQVTINMCVHRDVLTIVAQL